MLQITHDLSVDDRDLSERFVRASGPGGQNVNKVATAVELRFDLKQSALPEEIKERLRVLAGRRLHADGGGHRQSSLSLAGTQPRSRARTLARTDSEGG